MQTTSILLSALIAVFPASALAQAPPPSTSIELSATDIQSGFRLALETLTQNKGTVFDRNLVLEDIGRYNLGVAVVARTAGTSSNSLSHNQITEIYYVISGSGVHVTGTMADPMPRETPPTTPIGPSMSSNSPILNAKTTILRPGDIQVIPPGVAHGFMSVDPGGIQYLIFRIDPDHVITAAREPVTTVPSVAAKR